MSKGSKKRTFSSYFTNNLGLKLLSILFAFILWSFVITASNQERTKTVSEVAVNITGLSDLESLGYTTRDNLSEANLTVKVKVNVARTEFKLIDKNFITASLDLSEITKDGTCSVPVKVSFGNTADVSLVSVTPASYTVTVDALASKDVPVTVNETGQLAENLVSYSPVIPDSITVTGSSYYVERITRAIADIDLSDLSDGEIVSAQCRFTDEKDNAIKFSSSRVKIDMDIQTVRELPVNLDETFKNIDGVADGYQFVSAKAQKIKVCGHLSQIKKLNELTVKEVDLSGKDDTFTSCILTPVLPEGIHLLPNSELPTASVKITTVKQSLTVKSPLIVSGLADGYTAVITADGETVSVTADGSSGLNVNVVLTGTASALENLVSSDVIVKLPCLDKVEGTYVIVPIVSVNASFASTVTSQLLFPTQVTLTIKKNQ